MKSEQWILSLMPMLFACSSFTVPVNATTVAEASKEAEAIVTVDAGPNEFDDLPEGKVLKLKSSRFALRKQQFKVLKVYKNATKVKLSVGEKLWIKPRGMVCFEFPASVKKEHGKLKLTTITTAGKHPKTTESLEEVAKPEKDVLFLTAVITGKQVEWYHSEFPLPLNEDTQKELDAFAAKPAPVKKVVQMGSECNTKSESKNKEPE